jgi:hypothetical protein
MRRASPHRVGAAPEVRVSPCARAPSGRAGPHDVDVWHVDPADLGVGRPEQPLREASGPWLLTRPHSVNGEAAEREDQARDEHAQTSTESRALVHGPSRPSSITRRERLLRGCVRAAERDEEGSDRKGFSHGQSAFTTKKSKDVCAVVAVVVIVKDPAAGTTFLT